MFQPNKSNTTKVNTPKITNERFKVTCVTGQLVHRNGTDENDVREYMAKAYPQHIISDIEQIS